MSTYQINYNSFTNNDSLMILKGLADFEDIEKAEEFIQEKSWVDGKQYNILDIKGLFVVYTVDEAKKINKIYDYDIVDRPESIKRYHKAKRVLEKVKPLYAKKVLEISEDAKLINVYYKNGRLQKQLRVDQIML